MALSQQEFEKLKMQLQSKKTGGVTAPIAEIPDYLSRVGTELKGAYQGLQKTTERGAELMGEGDIAQGAVMSALGAPAAVVRAAFSPITAAISPFIEKGLKASGITESKRVQDTLAGLDTWAKAHPDAAENLKNFFETGSTIVGARGATAIAPAVERGIKTGAEITTGAIKTGIESVAPLATGVADVTKMAVGGASRIPGRIATNVAEKQAQVATIKSLPTEIARKAAQNGIDPIDVKKMYAIPQTAKPKVKELADNIVKFAKGESDVDPIEIVGKPIIERAKRLEKLRGTVGQKLGAVAEKLGNVSSTEAIPPIANALRAVPGLKGIKISTSGKIDFTDTVLATAETASDRKAIQNIFTQAVQSSTGKQKHLLRQELFEILGGKKRAQVQLTGTQEQAYEAIRKGLSNVLDSKDATYKTLSSQYRKVIEPLSEIRKKLRAVPGVTEDVLDMSAGLLARRLTSTSITQGELRTILKKLDDVTKIKGKTLESTEALQDVYNVLGKYYDIAPKTGFQGQVKAGMEGATGLVDMATGALRSVAGETSAVRQKALEDLLREILQ